MDEARTTWEQLAAGPAFGEVLRTIREIKCLSRKDLEVASRRSYSQLRGLELGDRWPSDKMLTSVGPALGLAPSTLVLERDKFLTAAAAESAEGKVRAWLHDLAPKVDDRFSAKLELSVGRSNEQRADVAWQLDGRTAAVFEVKALPTGGVVLIAATLDATVATSGAVQELLATYLRSATQALAPSLIADLQAGQTDAADVRDQLARAVYTRVHNLKGTDPETPVVSRRLAELLSEASDRHLLLVEGYLEGLLAADDDARRGDEGNSDTED